MKRTFILEDLDCGHCAQKIEDKVSKIEGISNCKVTFLTQKLVYEVEDALDKEIEAKVKKTIKELNPDVTVENA